MVKPFRISADYSEYGKWNTESNVKVHQTSKVAQTTSVNTDDKLQGLLEKQETYTDLQNITKHKDRCSFSVEMWPALELRSGADYVRPLTTYESYSKGSEQYQSTENGTTLDGVVETEYRRYGYPNAQSLAVHPNDTTEGILCPSNAHAVSKDGQTIFHCKVAKKCQQKKEEIFHKILKSCECSNGIRNCSHLLSDITSYHKEIQRSGFSSCCGPAHTNVPNQDINCLLEDDIKKLSRSVGLLVYDKNDEACKEVILGTCSCVGGAGIIITCHHVIHNDTVFKDGYNLEEHMNIFAYFQDRKRKFGIKRDIIHESFEKDYIVLYLSSPDETYPPAIQPFREVPPDDVPACVFGYQNGKLVVDNKAYIFNDPKTKQKFKAKNVAKVLLTSRLLAGASGGIAVCRNDEGSPAAVLMYQQGFPFEYHSHWNCSQKLNYPSCHIWEQGIGVDVFGHLL